jgi:hypothetical protein
MGDRLVLVHLPHPSSISVVVWHHSGRSQLCFDELGRSPPHLFLYLVLLFKEKDGNKKEGSTS